MDAINKQLESMNLVVDPRSLAVKEFIDTFKGAKCGYDFKEKVNLNATVTQDSADIIIIFSINVR